MAHVMIKRPADDVAEILAEIGYAQDTREQMRAIELREFLDGADSLARFAGIVEGQNEEIEDFLFD